MAKLGTILQIVPAEIFTSSSTQQAVLGSYAETPDGRGFRYVQNGATAAVPGRLYQSSAETTNHQNLVPAAASVGDTSIDVKLGASAALVDEYADGFLIVTANASEGRCYGIGGHAAVASSGTLTARLSEPIQVAIDTSSTVDLVRNPYRSVVVNPTTVTGAPVGVALHGLVASEYGWLQTHGPGPVVAQSAVVVGLNLISSTAEAGAVETTEVEENRRPMVGYALTGVADSEFGVAYLMLD